MIRFHAFGVLFSFPLPLLLLPLLARQLGSGTNFLPLACALGLHELSHILSARLTGVEIQEIRILPFGGSARMENPYGLSPRQLIFTAVAGPLSNLTTAICLASLAHWHLVLPEFAAAYIQPNLILMLFNLFPALPLDGGRILYALLQRPLGEINALKICRFNGRLLSCALLLITLLASLRTGKWNLSFPLAAVFILSAEEQESRALLVSRAQRLLSPQKLRIRPARIYHLDEQQSLGQAIKLMRPWEDTWFVLTRSHIPCSMIDGQSLLLQLHAGMSADAALSELSPIFKETGISAT